MTTNQQQPSNGNQVYTPSVVGRASDVFGYTAPADDQSQVQPPATQQQVQQQQQQIPNQQQQQQYQFQPGQQQGYFGQAPQVPQLPTVPNPANQQQQQQTQAPPPGQQQQQVDPFQQQQQHLQNVQQARGIVESIDVEALRQRLSTVTRPGQQQHQQTNQQTTTQQQTTATPPGQQQQQQQGGEADKNFAAFNQQFKEVMGVDLQTGINNYKQLVQISQDMSSAMKQQQQQVALREAKIDLASAWMMDADVQVQMQQGTPITQIVEDRMQYLGRVYQSLPQQDRQQVDVAGTAGVIALWRSTKQQSQSQQVPIGSVGVQQQQQTFQSPTGQVLTREQIYALSDADFEAWGSQLLDSGNYAQTPQPQQGVNNYGTLQRTFR